MKQSNSNVIDFVSAHAMVKPAKAIARGRSPGRLLLRWIADRRRRPLARPTHALNDHLLRDIGVSRADFSWSAHFQYCRYYR